MTPRNSFYIRHCIFYIQASPAPREATRTTSFSLDGWIQSQASRPRPPATELLFSAGSSPTIQSQSAAGAVTKYPRLGGINNRRSVSQIWSCQSTREGSAGLSSGRSSCWSTAFFLCVFTRHPQCVQRDRLFSLPLTRTLTHHEAPLLTNLTLFTSQRP